jgi:hypothetical protein
MSDCPKHYWCLPERCTECPDTCDQACVCHGQFTAPDSCQCCTPSGHIGIQDAENDTKESDDE